MSFVSPFPEANIEGLQGTEVTVSLGVSQSYRLENVALALKTTSQSLCDLLNQGLTLLKI